MTGAIITIDTNEATHHPEYLRMSWDGCLVSSANLAAGDFQIIVPDGTTILIERKSVPDLMASIADGRLFNQVAEMVKITPWCYVMIYGVMMETETGTSYAKGGEWVEREWSWSSIQGSLLSVQEMGCGIVYTTDIHATISQLMNRSRNDVKIAPRREPYTFSPHETVLMSLPGIGSKKAQEILAVMPSLGMALEYLTGHADVSAIQGIGSKTRDNMRQFFGGKMIVDLMESE